MKKKTTSTKPIRLAKETLRRLDQRELANVAAGEHPTVGVSAFEMCD